MAVTIGSNILSQTVQRNLSRSSESLSTASERLSSGQRINKASDDAAGLAVSSALNAKARVYSTAMRNISDGISLLSIADAALESQSGIITRLQELAEQSANGTYSNTQREALHSEYRALIAEHKRIGDSTEFNGIRLSSGGGSSPISLQIGADGSSTSQVTIGAVGSGVYQGTQAVNTDYNKNGFVDGVDATNGQLLHSGIATTDTTAEQLSDRFGGAIFEFSVQDSQGAQRRVYVAPTVYGFGSSEPVTNATIVLFAGFYRSQQGTFVSASGVDPTIRQANSSFRMSLSFDTGATASLDVDFSQINFVGTNSVSSPTRTIEVNSDVIAATGIETSRRARTALDVLSRANVNTSATRSIIGAFQSRLQTSLNLATISRETSTQASSRIVDADVATEAADYISNGILQETAAALLGQANQTPQIGLQLLRNA